MTRPSLLALLGAVLAVTTPADALIVRGGGSVANDCFLVFDAPANTPPDKPKHVRCTDGDACDADGVVNGSCQFAIGVCANSTLVPGCSSNGVQSVTVALPSGGKVRRDSDKINLTCDPAPQGCDPQAFYDGTFDRIQKQIFNQRCATSGCHDSQSHQSNMILETGSAYGNIVGVTPTNPNVPVDWKRVLPGDSTRSFLFHKVNGDLTAGQGSQMPLTGPPLDAHLIDIIRLWIDAGAPDMGWVPGTEN